MKIILPTSFLFLFGCSSEQENFQEQLAKKNSTINKLKQALSKQEEKHSRQTEVLKEDLKRNQEEHKASIKDYAQRFELKVQRITMLEDMLQKEKAYSRKLQKQYTQKQTPAYISSTPPHPHPFPIRI
ncbi:MAG: hypothetical protein GKR87_08575 [Kiritimatiellae bacterium]|nr:hypothetical protein [Kiritimatiellia bacterium]